MREFARPIVVVSKCLGFDKCRYNGATIPSEIVDKLQPHVEFKMVCPEVEIGLGVPRDPIRVVLANKTRALVQPATGLDITDRMLKFTGTFLDSMTQVHGFILKSRSPSCGIKDVKIFAQADSGVPLEKGSGFFGGKVLERFSHLAVEDEGRLTNFRLREHFLTKLFTLAAFSRVKSSNLMKNLVQFQTENKFLMMAYNQKELRLLGRIVANLEKRPISNMLSDYGRHLSAALARPPRSASNINVLMHCLGYFSKDLSHREKAFFLDALERYRAGKVPFSVPSSVVRSWTVRFEQEYLMQQTIFEPYPEDLVEITDSGKGREL